MYARRTYLHLGTTFFGFFNERLRTIGVCFVCLADWSAFSAAAASELSRLLSLDAIVVGLQRGFTVNSVDTQVKI